MMSVFNLVGESVPFEDMARHYGIEFNHNGKAPCQFHNEKTESFDSRPGHKWVLKTSI